ncbi:MAG: EamA family transporter [Vibrio sp.]
MAVRDRLLALTIILVWGVNFVIIKVGLQGMPPLLLAGLRFLLVAFPAIFFFARPTLPLKWIFLYGMTISFGQFALLFWALNAGLSAGLASLLLQVQAFVTIVLSAILFKERVRRYNVIAMLVAITGIVLLATAPEVGKTSINWFTLALVLGAACSWALGNINNKVILSNYTVPTMSLIVWSAIFPTCAFFITSYYIEGPSVIQAALSHIQWHNIGALLYLSLMATIVGYGGWSYLLSRYQTSLIAPLSLLVPVFGLLSAWILLGETLSLQQWIGAGIVAAGLVYNTFGAKTIPYVKATAVEH